jgi:hypothetical protein
MKIRPVGPRGRTYGRTDTHDEANSRFSQFYEHVNKRPPGSGFYDISFINNNNNTRLDNVVTGAEIAKSVCRLG